METHKIHEELLRRQVRVLVVGCGGTGSAVAAGLPYLHQAMLACGHPEGLHVTLMDGDTISPTNCVRQPFSRSEVGLYKAVVLVNRINIFWGLNWEAVLTHLSDRKALSSSHENGFARTHIVIGCVDTRAARAVIRDATGNFSSVDYWLDIGNNADSGQFILGEPLNQINRRARTRLRTVAEWFPEIVDPSLDNDGLPSCSAAEAIERQEPFLNQTLAQHALALLARLFRYGMTSHYGGFINLVTGACAPWLADPGLWRRATARRRREAENRNSITKRAA
jgi:PRTRC genetic system ThiF family protein